MTVDKALQVADDVGTNFHINSPAHAAVVLAQEVKRLKEFERMYIEQSKSWRHDYSSDLSS